MAYPLAQCWLDLRLDVSAGFAGWQSGEKQGKVTKLSKNEVLMLNIGSMCTGAKVVAVWPQLLPSPPPPPPPSPTIGITTTLRFSC